MVENLNVLRMSIHTPVCVSDFSQYVPRKKINKATASSLVILRTLIMYLCTF